MFYDHKVYIITLKRSSDVFKNLCSLFWSYIVLYMSFTSSVLILLNSSIFLLIYFVCSFQLLRALCKYNKSLQWLWNLFLFIVLTIYFSYFETALMVHTVFKLFYLLSFFIDYLWKCFLPLVYFSIQEYLLFFVVVSISFSISLLSII